MTLTRTGLSRSHVGLVWAAALAALLVGAPAVRANIQPPTMLVIHVQPWDPSYCDLAGVNSCWDLVQTTSQTGQLLFVVYMACGGGFPPGSIAGADFTLQWNWGWWPMDLANCTDAEFSYEYDYYNYLTVHFDWPTPPDTPGFMPLCALLLDADGHGCCEILDDAQIHWGVYPYGWDESPLPGKAEVGVDCEYTCLLDCHDWYYPCVPQLTPEELHLMVPKGQEAEGLLQSVATGCWADDCRFDATEPWVTLEVEQTSYQTHDIHVTVSAVGLAVGEYEARVRATCDARDCSRIYLTVTQQDPQSIPEDDAASPPGSQRTTWGAVKDLYR